MIEPRCVACASFEPPAWPSDAVRSFRAGRNQRIERRISRRSRLQQVQMLLCLRLKKIILVQIEKTVPAVDRSLDAVLLFIEQGEFVIGRGRIRVERYGVLQ